MDAQLIDSSSALKTFIDSLLNCTGIELSLHINLEVNNLSRNGTLLIITILVKPLHTVYLINVIALGLDAFEVAGSSRRTLQQILKSGNAVKVFIDICNNSYTLFGLFGIDVKGIKDLYLIELAFTGFYKRCINSLAKCIKRDASAMFIEKQK